MNRIQFSSDKNSLVLSGRFVQENKDLLLFFDSAFKTKQLKKFSNNVIFVPGNHDIGKIDNDFKFNDVELEGTRELDEMRLIRVIVRSNDPLKRESAGEIFTVGNRELNGGTPVKKYIPFNNEDGWHIPNVLYKHLKAAERQIFSKVTRNGQDFMEPRDIKAFNVEVLPPITEEEREVMEVRQKSTGSIG